MNKLCKISLAALLTSCVLLLCACGWSTQEYPDDLSDSGSAISDPNSALDTPYIGIILKSLNNSYFDLIKAGVEDEAADLGVSAMVVALEDEGDTADQADMLLTMANMAVDVIAIAPVEEAMLEDGLQSAEQNDKIILAIDSPLDFDGCACYIGTDNYNAAYQQGAYAAQLAGENSAAVILRGRAEDKVHTLRENGLTDGLLAGGAVVHATKVCNSSADEAEKAMSKLLKQNTALNVVCTTSDTMAIGAQRAIKAAGRDDIHIVSFDGMQDVSELVRTGEIDAVFAQNAYEIGRECIRTAVSLYRGESVPKTIYTDVELITRDNAQQHLDTIGRLLRHQDIIP